MSVPVDAASLSDLLPQLQELLDKQAIKEVTTRYCRGVDRRDRRLIEETFYFTSPDDFEPRVGGPRLADYMEAFGPQRCHTHFIGNQLIDIAGREAFAETYFVSVHERHIDGVDYSAFRGGRYLDQLHKFGDYWKIVRRQKVDDWDRLDAITERLSSVGEQIGLPYPDDRVYAVYAEWKARISSALAEDEATTAG
jgi:SnoaL-like domain